MPLHSPTMFGVMELLYGRFEKLPHIPPTSSFQMYSRMTTPFGGIKSDFSAVHDFLQESNLPQPETMPNSIYELCLDCWKRNPLERPTFDEITLRLGHIVVLPRYTPHTQSQPNHYITSGLDVTGSPLQPCNPQCYIEPIEGLPLKITLKPLPDFSNP
ncbi:hypothetical protein Pelo_5661 [Pelomyxa schiedti]|nr:hypothetical protein Pelo_5661 [Pelomyxa schiedti]